MINIFLFYTVLYFLNVIVTISMVQIPNKWSSLTDKHVWMDNPRELLYRLEPIMGNTGCLRSSNDVNLLVKVMEASYMLVTQCIVLNILKQTKAPSTLECFVNSRGWVILIEWLKIAKERRDYSIIVEIVHLLLKFPVNIDNLKEGNVGKIVKQFSKSDHQELQTVAKRVLLKWKTYLKGYQNVPNIKNIVLESQKNKLVLSATSTTESQSTDSTSSMNHISTSDLFTDTIISNTRIKGQEHHDKYNTVVPTKLYKVSLQSKIDRGNSDVYNSERNKAFITVKDNLSSDNFSIQSCDTKEPILRFYGGINSRNSVNKPLIKRSESNSSEASIFSPNTCLVQSKKFSEAFLESTSLKKLNVKRNSSYNTVQQKIRSFGQTPDTNSSDNFHRPIISPTQEKCIEFEDEGKSCSKKNIFDDNLKVSSIKKKVTWASDEKLAEVRYIELDDSEKANFHSHGSFYDAIQQEKLAERTALARIFANDRMLALVEWIHPRKIDIPDPLVVYGSKSEEKEVQLTRERSVLALLFLNKECAPDDPLEPDIEDVQTFREPKIIPHYEPGKEISQENSIISQPQLGKDMNIDSLNKNLSNFQHNKLLEHNSPSMLLPFTPLPTTSLIPNLGSNCISNTPIFNINQIDPSKRNTRMNIMSPKQAIQDNVFKHDLQLFSSHRNPILKKTKSARGRGRNTRYCQHFLRGFCKNAQNCNFIH